VSQNGNEIWRLDAAATSTLTTFIVGEASRGFVENVPLAAPISRRAKYVVRLKYETDGHEYTLRNVFDTDALDSSFWSVDRGDRLTDAQLNQFVECE
jgi:hypothetical protein